MNEATVYRFGHKIYGEKRNQCEGCGGLGRACYKFFAGQFDQCYYVILPCKYCARARYDVERLKKKYPPLGISERWVTATLEQQGVIVPDASPVRLVEESAEPANEDVEDSSE